MKRKQPLVCIEDDCDKRAIAYGWCGSGIQTCIDEEGRVLMRGETFKSVLVLSTEDFQHLLAHARTGDFGEVTR